MFIHDHGAWASYTPDEFPAGIPPSLGAKILWFKNDGGEDFYAYRNAGNFDAVSIKCSCVLEDGAWRVMTAHIDETQLVPDDRRIIEIYDGDIDDPLTSYQKMVYDPVANTLSPPPVVVQVPPSASKLGLKRVFSEMGTWSQIKAMIAADEDMQEEWDLALEIKRTDPLVTKLITQLGLSAAQVDALMIRSRELTA